MQIKIISWRRHFNQSWFDIVYEWEDIIARIVSAKIIHHNIHAHRFLFLYNLFLSFGNKWIVNFVMNAKDKNNCNNRKTIPWIIDYYLEDDKLKDFENNFSKNPLILISSAEVYQYLKEKKISLPIKHLALSLPDQYKFRKIANKPYNLVVVGNQNPVLLGFLDRYTKEHPDFEYVFRTVENGQYNCYTNTGKLVGNTNSHKDYIDLVSKAKVVLYTTKGIDSAAEHAHGYNQITPRFLEFMALGCHIIARYKDNADSRYYEIDKIAPMCDTYETFCQQLNYYISHDIDYSLYDNYLAKHYTSVRAKQLLKILKELD